MAQELGGQRGEDDAQEHGAGDAPQDHLRALLLPHARGGEPDDDGVVAGQHHVDDDDVDEGDKVQ